MENKKYDVAYQWHEYTSQYLFAEYITHIYLSSKTDFRQQPLRKAALESTCTLLQLERNTARMSCWKALKITMISYCHMFSKEKKRRKNQVPSVYTKL